MSIKSSLGKSKLALIAVLAVMSAAPPAWAQSVGYPGSPMPNYFESDGGRKWGSLSPPQSVASGRGLYASAGRRGLSAYGSVRHPLRDANGPAVTRGSR
jgi:hypothetical protein